MAEQQNRVPLPGSEKQPVAGAEEVGEVHPDERLEVTVRVRRRADQDLAAQLSLLASTPPEAREHLTREAYAERHGADPADNAKVEAFARANGLSVVEVSAARHSVVLGGTVAAVSAAFGVKLAQYSHPDGGTFRGRQGPIYIPADLDGIVQGVFGLDDRPAARPHIRTADELDRGNQGVAAVARTSFT